MALGDISHPQLGDLSVDGHLPPMERPGEVIMLLRDCLKTPSG